MRDGWGLMTDSTPPAFDPGPPWLSIRYSRSLPSTWQPIAMEFVRMVEALLAEDPPARMLVTFEVVDALLRIKFGANPELHPAEEGALHGAVEHFEALVNMQVINVPASASADPGSGPPRADADEFGDEDFVPEEPISAIELRHLFDTAGDDDAVVSGIERISSGGDEILIRVFPVSRRQRADAMSTSAETNRCRGAWRRS
jgi:hypothetical protein